MFPENIIFIVADIVNLFGPLFQKIHEMKHFSRTMSHVAYLFSGKVILYNTMPITCSQANCEYMTNIGAQVQSQKVKFPGKESGSCTKSGLDYRELIK